MITILSVERISANKIRLTTTEMVDNADYKITISNVRDLSGNVINPVYNSQEFTGDGTRPKLLSATAIDSTHIDLVFDEELLNGTALSAAHSYIFSGPNTPLVSNAILQPDKKTILVTLSTKMLNGDFNVIVSGIPNTAGNPVDVNYDNDDYSWIYVYPANEIIGIPNADYTEGSIIEVRAIGISFDEIYPSIELKIDDVIVATWINVDGNYDLRYIKENYYEHPGQVTIDQIKVGFTNPLSSAPDEAGLTYWGIDPLSTAIFSNEREFIINYYAKLVLTAPSGNPSELNSIIQSLGTVTADLALTAVAKMRAPAGVTGRMELWVFPAGPGELLSEEDFAGTGDWIDAELSSVTPTGTQLDPELRLITKTPDIAGSYVEWADVYVNQQLVTNPNFSPVVTPWFTNFSSRLTVTQLSEPAGTYVRGTVIKELEPPARLWHSMVYDASRSKNVMFGGFDGSGYYNDTWEWDNTAEEWIQISPLGGIKPSARGRYSMSYDSSRNVCVLFGGGTMTIPTNDTWEYNGATSTWTLIAPTGGIKPSARHTPAMAFDSTRNVIVLFGGNNGSTTYYNDTWEYDGTTFTWTQLFPGTKPTARYQSMFVYDSARNRFVLFGGTTATARLNETWEYNSATSTWVLISPTGGIKPTARSESGIAFDSVRNRCVLFAGQDGAVGGATHVANDTWEYNGATATWIQVEPGGTGGVIRPQTIVAFGMSYDISTSMSVVYGGYTGTGVVKELWRFTGVSATWDQVEFNPDPEHYGPSHFNSLCLDMGNIGHLVRCVVKLKVRAPVGTTSRIYLFAIPWNSTATNTYKDHLGTGDWEDIELLPFATSTTNDQLILRLIVWSPDVNGSWAEWKNVSVERNILKNNYFRPRTAVIDKVIVDGYGYESDGVEVYSTGTWLPGDGHSVVPGYKEEEFLTNNGNFNFSSVDEDSYMTDADTRIESIRKGNGVTTVLDSHSNPITGASISVAQTKHEFLFGSCFQFFVLDRISHPEWIPKIDTYEQKFGDIFNMGICGTFWDNYINPSDGVYSTTLLDTYLDICDTYNLTPQGVVLMYNLFEPTYVNVLSPANARSKQLDYITYLVDKYSGVIDIWEVVDEASICISQGFYQTTPGLTGALITYGRENMIKDSFAAAKAANPAASLNINDYHVDDSYYSLLDQLNTGGSYPFDVVKMQSHMNNDVWSNQRIWNVANRLGTYTGNVHFSETSIFSGPPLTTGGARLIDFSTQPLLSWRTTDAGEAQQAIEVERYYRLAFSNPYIKSISWWNLTDWYAWYWDSTPADTEIARGLLRSDMSNKPAFDVLHNLIKNEWWTTISGVTNGAGQFSFRGFAGTYNITVSKTGYAPVTQQVTLSTAGSSWTITLT